MKRLRIEWLRTIRFFVTRDEYRVNLRKMIKEVGLSGLTPVILRTVPTDMKVLYEIKWWLQPFVWIRIMQVSILNAQNEGMRRVQNG